MCPRRTCRLAPLIQCDYCPLLFHMSCTDPPLSAMPTGAWLCSSHTQHEAAVAVSGSLHPPPRLPHTPPFPITPHFLGPVPLQGSLTFGQRCQLLDNFQDRISQQAVKVDFLQRAHHWPHPQQRGMFKVTTPPTMGHTHFRRKSSYVSHTHTTVKSNGNMKSNCVPPPPLNNPWQVPEAIKSLYRCPLTLRAPDGIRVGELICNGVSDPPLQHPPPSSSASTCRFTSEDEQREVGALPVRSRHTTCIHSLAFFNKHHSAP